MEVFTVAIPGDQKLAVVDDVIDQPLFVAGHRVLDDQDELCVRHLLDVAVFVELRNCLFEREGQRKQPLFVYWACDSSGRGELRHQPALGEPKPILRWGFSGGCINSRIASNTARNCVS